MSKVQRQQAIDRPPAGFVFAGLGVASIQSQAALALLLLVTPATLRAAETYVLVVSGIGGEPYYVVVKGRDETDAGAYDLVVQDPVQSRIGPLNLPLAKPTGFQV